MNLENLEFTELEVRYVQHAANHYKTQALNIPVGETKESATLALLNLIDEINDDSFAKEKSLKPSCRKGCSHCCHIQVGTTEREVDLILDYMYKNERSFTEDELATLHEQAKYDVNDPHNYMIDKNRKCVFLKNSECSIYPVRPATCRNYFVMSDPKECDTYTLSNERVAANFNLETIPPIIALMDLSEVGSLSQLILKNI